MNIVKSGVWLYDNAVEKPVDIVALDYDWWYEMALEENSLEPGEGAGPFDKNGHIYYVRFQYAGITKQVGWVDSSGHSDMSAAIKEAELKAPSRIRWLGA